MRSVRLAKLTRPRLHGAVARERLFARLDEERERRRGLCVVGPPGAGKTTLAASWLDARELDGIWYQVDAGDADLATFFYYLAQAAQSRGGEERRALPLLTPEYMHDVPGFARRFLRELFGRLPSPGVVVLDNYQEVAPQERFHEIVSLAVDELPEGLTLMALSRSNPPSHYARLIANRNVVLVEWDELRLRLEETRAIAALRCRLDDEEVRLLHERSGGWAAGLTLLIEHRRQAATENATAAPEGLERIFDYFAAQIFERVEPETQRFLVATAYLPRTTVAMAEALTGRKDAAGILEGLYQRHLFTHRRAGVQPTYQYHALFQAFLIERGRALLSEDERAALRLSAARLLEATGLSEDAVTLYREAAHWDGIVALVRRDASMLIGQGRGQTLREWIEMLPAELLETEPWMIYWLAVSQIALAPRLARSRLERGFEIFGRRDDRLGQTLAACGVLETYYREMSFFQPMDRWITVLEELLSVLSEFESMETRLRVYSTLLLAIMYRVPKHPLREDYAREVMRVLDADIRDNTRLTAATFLLSYCTLTGMLDMGRRLIDKIGPLATGPEISPVNQHWWHARLGFFHFHTGEAAQSLAALDRADRIAELNGLDGGVSPTPLFSHYRLLMELALGNLRVARGCLDRIAAFADPSRGMHQWHLHQATLEYLLAAGHTGNLLDEAVQACDAAEGSGMRYLLVRSRISLCWVHALTADHEETMRRIEETRAEIEGGCFSYYEVDLKLVEAYSLLLRERREEAHQALRRGLSEARRSGAPLPEKWFRAAMERLCAEALSAGIETDYVRRFVLRHRLTAPADAEHWPWPLKIFTLGGFRILRDDEPLEFSGKAPRKPLALLKAVIALGGEDVPQQQLFDVLWPDEEGDAAQNAFGVALARLRKLLGDHDAVILRDQKVTLNPKLCWLDVRAFDRFLVSVEGRLGNGAVGSVLGIAERGSNLYRGNFLSGDGDEPWTLQTRLRLRGRFTRFVETLGEVLERAGEWQKAVDWYYRGLEADDLIEEFYLGLMRCYRALGRPADGIAVYRRMRQTLSVVLNVKPSTAAESLAEQLRAATGV